MNQGLLIRRLGSQDAALAAQLNDLFAEAFEDAESYQSARASETYLTRVLAKPEVVALVAVADGAAVGGLVAYELAKLEQERSEFYIYDLAVRENFRRQGVATALIAEVQRIAKARGGWVVYVQADYEDPPAVALYTKLGRREEVLHFDLPVERG